MQEKVDFLMKRCNLLRMLTILFVLTLPIGTAPLEAGLLTELTWEDAVKEARKNHPDLISAQEKLNQAQAGKTIVRSAALPQLSSSVSARTFQSAGVNRIERYSYNLSLRQLVFDGFKTSYSIARASKNIKAAQYNYQLTSSEVRQRLRVAFVGLLRAQKFLGITQDISQRRHRNMELVKLRYEAGREHRGALLIAQADLARSLFEVTQAERSINLFQRRLMKELGRQELKPIRAAGILGVLQLDTEKPAWESLAEANPLLGELGARQKMTELALKSAQAEFFPQVYADMSAGRSGADFLAGEDEWSVGISLRFPLFDGGRRSAEVSQAKSMLNQVEADKRSLRDRVMVALEEAWTERQNAGDKIKVQGKFLGAAKERAKIAREQYAIGLISFDSWTIIEDSLVKAEKSFLDAQARILIVEANWVRAKGGTL